MADHRFPRDVEYEALNKLPREGMWNMHGGMRTLRCPVCHCCPTVDNHSIADDGRVSPSVVCPLCTFHEYIVLDGWKGDSND
jgi:hypothetical protein